MKKTLLFLLIAGMISVSSLYASEYYLYGEVFDASGSSGTAATSNSFGMLQAYRLGIAGQIGLQNENPGNQIYAANGTLPAYYDTDVGDAQWTTPPAVGQTAISVIEVFNPLFGWTGDSYVACTETVISSDDVNINQETDFSNLGLRVIPTPAIISQDANQITIGFTGIDMDLIQSYTLYRGTTPTFTTATATAVAVIPQNRNNAIQYTDNTGLVYGTTYYYKILVDFTWGGGGGAPAYYETNATSAASGPAAIATYTPTASATLTPTATLLISETPTYTVTETFIASETPTYTVTPTVTEAVSGTATSTATATMTNTPVSSCWDSNTVHHWNCYTTSGGALVDDIAGANASITGTLAFSSSIVPPHAWAVGSCSPQLSASNYFTMPSSVNTELAGMGAFQIDFDVYMQGSINQYQGFYSKGTYYDPDRFESDIDTSSGNWRYFITSQGGQVTSDVWDAGTQDSTWHHVIISWDGTYFNGYWDGIHYIVNVPSGNPFQATGDLPWNWAVGDSSFINGTLTFKGYISEITISNKDRGGVADAPVCAYPTFTATKITIPTATDTPVNTATSTPVNTATDTVTATITPTSTITSTFTETPMVTDTPTPPVSAQPYTYPQPAANTVTFAYNLTAPSSVKIYVYNLIGVRVAVFEQSGSQGMNYLHNCDISKFAPGIYFYLIKAPDAGVKFAVNKFEVER